VNSRMEILHISVLNVIIDIQGFSKCHVEVLHVVCSTNLIRYDTTSDNW